jgi:hypothetical protein
MKKTMNFTTSVYDTERYTDNADLKTFYRGFGFDGLELMRAGDDKKGIVSSDDVIGIHLRYLITWMDLWTGNEQRLKDEFGDYDAVSQTFGGTNREAITRFYIDNLNAHPYVLPEYLVFHVSECQLAESMLRQYHYSSDTVIDAAIELVDSFSEAIQTAPVLLFENLWYPGLTMLEPHLTFKLLEKVTYPHTGVMLDIGHLLNTNTTLRTIDEGVDYVHKILDMYGDLAFIKGIHLHQSLSGEYAQELMRTWTPSGGSYNERRLAVMPHIFKIDTHQPFASKRVNELIDRIQPEYLVIELLSSDRFEHTRYLEEQLRYLK